MGGDVKWPIIGSLGTVIMIGCTRLYSRNCVRQAYITADQKRLGFQVHTMFAVAGPKVEASIHNVQLVNEEQQKMLMRAILPIKLEGMDKNLLLDADGIYYDNGKLIQLLEENKLRKENPTALYNTNTINYKSKSHSNNNSKKV